MMATKNIHSNYWQRGEEQRVKSATHFYGEMRYGKLNRPSLTNRILTLLGVQIEYLVVTYDDEKREVRLSLRQADILEALSQDEELLKQGGGVPDLGLGDKK